MKITDVKTVLLTGPISNDPYLLPLRKLRSAAFVEIHTDGRHMGIGETYVGYFLPEVVPAIVDFYKPILVGQDLESIGVPTLYRRMVRSGMYWGRVGLGSAVISALESALWDLKGKMVELPVYELLGGRCHDRMLAYATGAVSAWPLEQLREKIDYYLNLGFRAFKVATGYWDMDEFRLISATSRGEAVDMESKKLEAMRRHVGRDVGILMDGHMGHSDYEFTWDLDTAKAVLRSLEENDLFLFEEPLPYTDPWGYAELRRSTAIPVAGGEQLTTLPEFRFWAELDSLDVAQLDAGWVGGMEEFVRIAAMFGARNRKIATHGWGAGGVIMQNTHAALAAPNTVILEVPPAAGPLHTEVWGDSFQLRDGYVLPPTAPGLGVRLTEEVKKKHPFQPGTGEFSSVPGKVMST